MSWESSGAGLGLLALSLGSLVDQRLVDVGDNSSSCDGRLDQCVQLLVSADGKLKMAGSNPLHSKIPGRVPSKLQHLSAEVLADRSHVDGRSGAYTAMSSNPGLEMAMNSSDGKLQQESAKSKECYSADLQAGTRGA